MLSLASIVSLSALGYIVDKDDKKNQSIDTKITLLQNKIKDIENDLETLKKQLNILREIKKKQKIKQF